MAHFWRKAGGVEVDLLLESGGALHAMEFKTARASSSFLVRGLRAIMYDTGAVSSTVIDQGAGADPLSNIVSRRGFIEAIH